MLPQLEPYEAKIGITMLLTLVLGWYVLFDVKSIEKQKVELSPVKVTEEASFSVAGSNVNASASTTTAAVFNNKTIQSSKADRFGDSNDHVLNSVDGWIFHNTTEIDKVKELRHKLRDLHSQCTERPLNLSDVVLVRFVRARKTLNESETLFRDAHKFRLERQPEKLLKGHRPHPLFKRYFPGGWCGFDKEGSPIWIDRIGQCDPSGLVDTIAKRYFVEETIWRQEMHTLKMIESQKKFGRLQYQMVLIGDLAGLSMRHYHQKGFQVLKSCSFIDDHYYPERLKIGFLINAPRVFTVIWSVVKYFFNPETRAKVRIFSGIPKEELLSHVDADTLPKFLGGNLELNGDPYCGEILPIGGKIPKELCEKYKNDPLYQ